MGAQWTSPCTVDQRSQQAPGKFHSVPHLHGNQTEQKIRFDPRDLAGLETQDESNPIKKKAELPPSPEARRSFLCLNTIKISALAKWHVTSTGRAEKRCNYLIVTAECWRRSEDHSRRTGPSSGGGGEGVTARGGGLRGGRKAEVVTGAGQEEGTARLPNSRVAPQNQPGPLLKHPVP